MVSVSSSRAQLSATRSSRVEWMAVLSTIENSRLRSLATEPWSRRSAHSPLHSETDRATQSVSSSVFALTIGQLDECRLLEPGYDGRVQSPQGRSSIQIAPIVLPKNWWMEAKIFLFATLITRVQLSAVSHGYLCGKTLWLVGPFRV